MVLIALAVVMAVALLMLLRSRKSGGEKLGVLSERWIAQQRASSSYGHRDN